MTLISVSCGFALAAAWAASVPERVIWRDPGRVESLDLAVGPGAGVKPKAPFRFLREDRGGGQPKIVVRDDAGREWRVKFGNEVHADIFGARMAWACGYPAQTTRFVAHGHVEGAKHLDRAASHVRDGHFLSARFALTDPALRPVEGESWKWHRNPFTGTRELNGLKVLMMLLSNWDNKDARDEHRGSNTLILAAGGGRQLLYMMPDWGASLGRWGGVTGREKWDCEEFAEQSGELVRGVSAGGIVEWGFRGQHTDTFARDIRASDVRWLMLRLGRISDRQIRAGLEASGATAHETECFTRSLRRRIAALAAL